MKVRLGLGSVETSVGLSPNTHRATAHIEIDVHDPKPVLVIDGTPGRWFIDTLNEQAPYPGRLALDAGLDWNLENPNAVIARANQVLGNLTYVEVETQNLVEIDNLIQFN